MNIGFEDDDLKPFIEPSKEYNDPARIGKSDLSECFSFILVSYTCDPRKHLCPRLQLAHCSSLYISTQTTTKSDAMAVVSKNVDAIYQQHFAI